MSRPERPSALVIGMAVLGGALALVSGSVAPATPARSEIGAASAGLIGYPNVLLIVTDDQSTTTFDRTLMPSTFRRLVDEGVVFDRGYVNTSLCCPSRAEILTGLYQHHTGVDGNEDPLVKPSIVDALDDLGYRTLLAGKYLNGHDCSPLPAWDRWICADGAPYEDPQLNVDGSVVQFEGHLSDILASAVAEFVSQTPEGQPFFALYTPKNPHLPADDHRCDGLPVDAYRPPSFDEDTRTAGKPQYTWRPALSVEEIEDIDGDHRRMTRAVACLDPGIETVLASLSGDRERNTLVVYVSDNGYLYGEHRLRGKRWPYEESVRIPFVVRYPALAPEPRVSSALAQTVDIAPTIAELVGIPWGADGRSLLPVLARQGKIRSEVLIQSCQADSFPCTGLPSYAGVVTRARKYVEYVTGEAELYDLASDPHELRNLVNDPAWEPVASSLARRLADLRAEPPPETTIAAGPRGVVPPGMYRFTYFTQSRLGAYRCRLNTPAGNGQWSACGAEGTTVAALTSGSYTFEVQGTNEHGITDASPAVLPFRVSLTPVVVEDFGYSPALPSIPRGGAVEWRFAGPSPHTVTDRSGLGLFDSGLRDEGGRFSVTFPWAGRYRYWCTVHAGMAASVRIPVEVVPPQGDAATSFAVRWADAPAPPGLVFDVQLRHAGGPWEPWLEGQRALAATFIADRGAGRYEFRSRLRSPATGGVTEYSPAASATVE